MLNNIFGALTATTREVYNALETVTDYVIEDVKNIPDSIEKGWNEGLLNKDQSEQSTGVEEPKQSEQSTEQPKFKFGANSSLNNV